MISGAVCPYVCVFKILVSVKVLAGVLSHIYWQLYFVIKKLGLAGFTFRQFCS